MDYQQAMLILATCTFGMALLGWAYMLGFSNSKINRNESDIKEIKRSMERIGQKISDGLEKVYNRIDALPCKDSRQGKDVCR